MEAERGDRVPRGDSDPDWTSRWPRSLAERGAGEGRGAGGRGQAPGIGVVRPVMTRQYGSITQVGKLRHGGADV